MPLASIALGIAPALILQIIHGVQAIDPELVEMTHVFKLSRLAKLRYLWFPALVRAAVIRLQDQGLGNSFQQPRLLDWLSVGKNIDVATHAAGVDPARGEALLAAVGLADYAEAYPLALSGGQRQRVALARSFVIKPDVRLLHEPFSALDELTARWLRLLLHDLWQDDPPTGILVTHNMMEAAVLVDRVVILGGKPAWIEEVIATELPRPRGAGRPSHLRCASLDHGRPVLRRWRAGRIKRLLVGTAR